MQPVRMFLVSLGALLAMVLGTPALASAASITGQVVGPDDEPLSFVFVELHDRDDVDAMPVFASTDEQGEFRFSDLGPGNYLVRAAMSSISMSALVPQWFGDVSSRKHATSVPLADESSERSDITIRLVRGASLSGTVTGPSGTPVAALVTAVDEDGEFFAAAGSDASGQYRIAKVPPGRVTLRFRPMAEESDMVARYLGDTTNLDDATFFDVSTDDDLAGYDYRFANGRRISGCLTEDGVRPLSGVDVLVWTGSGPEPPLSTSSGADGCYTARGLADGDHAVGFAYGFRYSGDVIEYYDDSATLQDAERVTISGSDVTGIDATLPVPRSISGRVTGPDGDPLGGVSVTAHHEMTIGGMRTATTGADGRYRIVGVAEGRHTVSFAGARFGTRYFDDASSYLDATMLTVDGDTPHLTNVDAQLTERPHVRGTVTDDQGDAVAFARIVAIRNGCPVVDTLADDQGRYVLAVPAAGTYRVAFVRPGGDLPLDAVAPGTGPSCAPLPPPTTAGSTPPPDGTNLVTQYYDGADRLSGASPVDVPADAGVPDVNGELGDGGALSGRVLDDDEDPLVGVHVTAYAPDGAAIAETTTAADGSYHLRAVAPGSVTVRYAFASTRDGADPPGTRYYRDATDRVSAVAVSVNSGQTSALDDVTLEPPAAISGRVTDAMTGQAVAFSAVTLTRWDGDVPIVARVTTTSSFDGTYRFGGVPAGRYSVTFTGGGMASYVPQHYDGTLTGTVSFSAASVLDVAPGDDVTAIDAHLRVGGTVMGRVTARDSGLGLAGVTVTAWDADTGTPLLGTSTDANGDYRLPPLPVGVSVVLGFRPAAGSSYRPTFYGGSTLEDAEPVLPVAGSNVVRDQLLDTGGTVTGSVVYDDNGDPVEGATVSVAGDAGNAATLTEADGTFSLAGLASGRYQYHVGPRSGDPGISTSSTEEFEVADGTTTSLDPIRLEVGGFIVGRAAVAGEPAGLTAVEVTASTSDGTSTHGSAVDTDASGDYRVGPLPAGDYEVRFGVTDHSPGEFQEAELYYDGAEGTPSVDDAERVSVGPRSTASGIDVTFTPRVTLPPPPANTGAPSISGDATEGRELSALFGVWTGNPIGYDYRWFRCDGDDCSVIEGAEAATYVLAAADVGSTIQVGVVATNAGGSSSEVRSAGTDVVAAKPPPRNVALPSITGDPREGATLSGALGSWSDVGLTYHRQWLRCDTDGAACAPVDGATDSSYALAAADVGSTIRLRVTATQDGRTSDPAISTPTEIVVAVTPTVATPPAIMGGRQVGSTLTADSGSWTPSGTYSYEWRWLRCSNEATCETIAGATDATYALTVVDVGSRIAVEVRATRFAQTSEWARATPTAVVVPPVPVITLAPAISGPPVRDQTLTVGTGAWTDAPTAYAYRWMRCPTAGECSAIPGATTAQYRLVAADVGQQMVAEVQATNAGGTSAWAATGRTATVTAPRDPDPGPSPDPGPNPDPGADGGDQDPPGGGAGGEVPPPGGGGGGNPPVQPPVTPPVGGPPDSGGPPATKTKVSAASVESLRLNGGGAALQLQFRGGAKVRTTVTVTSRVALKVGKKRGKPVIAKVTLKSPKATTVKLSPALRKALRGRKSLPVTVRVAPKGGKAVTKRMTLRLA